MNAFDDKRPIHLTLTGPMAGAVLCGQTKTAENVYYHAAYLQFDAPWIGDRLCACCKQAWESDDE